MRLCAVVECERDRYRREWCNRHYLKWRKYGDPTVVVKVPTSPASRIWPKVDRSAGPDGCWPFVGALSMGYGAIGAGGRMPNGTAPRVLAHRVVYEMEIGPIPDGFQLDHLCHNADLACLGGIVCPHRRCVNPAHLEAVPQAVNLERQRAHWLATR